MNNRSTKNKDLESLLVKDIINTALSKFLILLALAVTALIICVIVTTANPNSYQKEMPEAVTPGIIHKN